MGQHTSKSGKASGIFTPKNTDEVAERIANAHGIRVSGSTITLKDEDGKTRGMIRGIRRFTEMRPADQSAVNAAVRAAGGLGEGVKSADIFEHEGQLYVLNSMYSQKTQAIMGENPGKNDKLRRLEQAGFIIVNYDRR